MGTCNFISQKNFPLVTCEPDLDEFEMDFYYTEAEELASDFSDELDYYTIELKYGYYDGFQFYVTENYSQYVDIDENSKYCLNDDDADYYFGKSKSEVLSEVAAEKTKICEWLCSLKDYGFIQLSIVGRFNNGSCLYEIAS